MEQTASSDSWLQSLRYCCLCDLQRLCPASRTDDVFFLQGTPISGKSAECRRTSVRTTAMAADTDASKPL